MQKKEFIEYWRGIHPNGGPVDTMEAVPYKHTGTTYAEDGIRLTGSREFIDSILGVLQPLLARESATERLQVVYQQSTDRETKALLPSWNCYIQVHQRGREAQAVNQFIEGVLARGTFNE